jgi:hypothetical protein
MCKKTWRTSTLTGDTSQWFHNLGLTEAEAIPQARTILETVKMEPSVLESALQWDEFVWCICHASSEVEELHKSWNDLNTVTGARRLVMYMTS